MEIQRQPSTCKPQISIAIKQSRGRRR